MNYKLYYSYGKVSVIYLNPSNNQLLIMASDFAPNTNINIEPKQTSITDSLLYRLKSFIFGALFIIQKNSIMPPWLFYTSVIIDYMQIVAYSLTSEVNTL